MPNRTVYAENTADSTTGEIVSKRWITRKLASEEQFIRTYVSDIAKLAKCTRAEQSVVLCSLKYLDYNTNELVIHAGRREDIARCGNLKPHTVDIAMSKLYKKNIFIKRDKMIFLNPEMFFYGTDLERCKVRELIIRYELEQTEQLS